MQLFYETLFRHWGVRLKSMATDHQGAPIIEIPDDDPEKDAQQEIDDLKLAMKGELPDDDLAEIPLSQDPYLSNSPLEEQVDSPQSPAAADGVVVVGMDLQAVDTRIQLLQTLGLIYFHFLLWGIFGTILQVHGCLLVLFNSY